MANSAQRTATKRDILLNFADPANCSRTLLAPLRCGGNAYSDYMNVVAPNSVQPPPATARATRPSAAPEASAVASSMQHWRVPYHTRLIRHPAYVLMSHCTAGSVQLSDNHGYVIRLAAAVDHIKGF